MTAPLPVLVARLEHELESARLYTYGDADATETCVLRAIEIAKQIREAL